MRDTDGDRLCWGTLTRLPVQPPGVIDAHTAGSAMLTAPVVGAALGVVSGALAWGVWMLRHDTLGALLAAVLALAFVAWATRAIHLDGLADTADALASGKPPAEALEIARRSDIGPFGVVVVGFVLAIDVVCLAANIADNHAMYALIAVLVAGRLALPLGCLRWVKPARADGLGAAVAGSVRPVAALAVAIGWSAIVGIIAAVIEPDDQLASIVSGVGSLVAALAAATVLLLIARRRLGGITGDVLGAMVEVGTAAALVVLALT